MKQKVLFKNMRRVLPLCLFFLVAGLTSCNSGLNVGTGLSWEGMPPSDSLEVSDSTEYITRVNLVDKEELPDWLITILDSMDERDAHFCGVFTAHWNEKKIYYIYNLLKSSLFSDVYCEDGSPLKSENGSTDLYKLEWCLIYSFNPDPEWINILTNIL
ncbi:MAG: hypothetical protein K6B45_05485 [Bacteroidaceae bacterium]|nr:hypothetical protein [Bacteroidaceae bacterium]